MILRRKSILWLGMIIMFLALVLPACARPPAEVKKIKIGVIGPMNFMQGGDAWNGAVMAAEEINKAGGVMIGGVKHEIELIKKDSNEMVSIPDAVSAFQMLATVDKVHFVVGGYRSEALLGMQEVMATYKLPFLNTGSASPVLTERVKAEYDKYKYFFRPLPINSVLAVPVVFGAPLQTTIDAIRNELGIEKPRVALLIEKAMYLDPVVPLGKALIGRFGGEEVGVWRPSPTAASVTAELSDIKAARAHIIYDIVAGPIGVAASKEWGLLQIPAALSGYNLESQNKGHWEATSKMCQYEMTMSPIARCAITEKTIPFFDAYLKKFGNYPTQCAATYDSVYLLAEAAKRTGTLEADAIVAELEKIKYTGAYGVIVFFPPGSTYPHDIMIGPGYSTAAGCQWRDGQLKGVWPDGRPLKTWANPDEWKGVRYEGTLDYKLPPWVVEYWKGK